MAIELSPPSPADPTPPRAPAAHTPGKAPGGFSSLLQGLGETVAQTATAPATSAAAAADGATATLPVGANDVGLLAAHSQRTAKSLPRGSEADAASPQAAKIPASLTDVPDAATGQPQSSTPDSVAQALLAQLLGLAGARGAASSASNVDAASGTEASRLRQAMPVGTSAPAAAPGVVAGTPAPQVSEGLDSPAVPAASGLGAVSGAGAGKHWLPTASAQPQAPWQSTVGSAGTTQDARALTASARDAGSQPNTQPLEGLTATPSTPALVNALADTDTGLNGRRRGAAAAESNRLDAPTPVGAAPSTIGPSAAGVATSGASASGQVLEQAVAEQVKYWISNDVQNAQLKFDGLGPQSVQVNISLSGNQAQVVFQSDQAHTRELLSNAMAQLEQMLRGEGLTLTSAWVGSSGQQGQFGSSAQQAQPAPLRAPAATTLAVEAASVPTRTAVSTNRAVDLFV